MVQTVCLDENKHAVTLLRKLKSMNPVEGHCDFVIKVGSEKYHTHKNILSAASEYFAAMLKNNTKESKDGEVEMINVDPECVKSCIDYIYSGKFDIPDGKIGLLLHVAIMVQLKEVEKAIADILEDSLTVANFFSTRAIADMYGFEKISLICESFFYENFMAIVAQPGFQDEKLTNLIEIFQSGEFRLSEQEKLTTCLKWIGENHENKENLFELLKFVDLTVIPAVHLNHLLENNPIVSNDLRLYKMLSNPLLRPTSKPINMEVEKIERSITKKELNINDLVILFDNDSDCLRSYNPMTDNITKFHNEKFKHLKKLTAAILDSYIYILCGTGSAFRLNFTYKNSKWEQLPDMIMDHGRSPSLVVHCGALYVIGGIGKNQSTTGIVEKFDPVTSNWVRLKDKPTAIAVAALVSLDDSIYCVGGWNEKGRDSKAFCRFNPAYEEWADLPPMESTKSFCGAIAVDRHIYVIAGLRRGNGLKDVECYNVATAQWTVLASMLKRHDSVKVHRFEGCIYAVSPGTSDSVEKYDIAKNEWEKVKIKGAGRFEISNSVSVMF